MNFGWWYKVQAYKFELISGPMGSGKTEELIRRLKRISIANKKIKVFSPAIDTRSLENCIESRNGIYHSALVVKDSLEIFERVEKDDEVIGIDELQFFDKNIVNVILKLLALDKKVIGAGLDLDFKAEPFGSMPELYCYADKIDKLTAICMKCGSEYGCRTQRLINGKPADRLSPLIMVGGNESYEARCKDCYEIFDVNEAAMMAAMVSSLM